MRNTWFWAFLIVLVILIGAFSSTPQKLLNWVKNNIVESKLIHKVTNSKFLPGPLRGTTDANDAELTREGVIRYTNDQRSIAGVPLLVMNETLNNSAQAKLNDMFSQQYFEHVSPQGKAPADLAKESGYAYIVIGENLALGNFKNDQTLVDAWMNSPGHRANILHPTFREIGVAVGKGTFEGKSVWLAIQEFGTPLSACTNSSSSLKSQIDNNRIQIDIWQKELVDKKSRVDRSRYSSQAEYQATLDSYNALVGKTNKLIGDTRNLVEEYNKQVNLFNDCLNKHD